jgi:hypothetical protein
MRDAVDVLLLDVSVARPYFNRLRSLFCGGAGAPQNEGRGRAAGGHESQSIILHYVQILLSVLDPDSAVFHSRKRMKNMLPSGTTVESKTVCFLN